MPWALCFSSGREWTVATPSPTSSSDVSAPVGTPRIDRRPWGLFSALLLLIVLEVVLRALNPTGVLLSGTDDERAYRGVVPELLAFGAPDVAIVGSSRARRGVIAPLVRDALATLKRDVRVGNFALGA